MVNIVRSWLGPYYKYKMMSAHKNLRRHLGNYPFRRPGFPRLLSTGVCVKQGETWQYIEDVLLDDKKEDGWQVVGGIHDITVYYLLSQIFYQQHDSPISELQESYYDVADTSDVVKLLWHQHRAIGFYTVKPKGSEVENTLETYNMTTLDTAYIRKSYRRQGFGMSLIKDLLLTWPDSNIGFSQPVSLAMWKVLEKFLSIHEDLRYHLWEVDGTGNEGSKKLIWFCLKKKKIT